MAGTTRILLAVAYWSPRFLWLGAAIWLAASFAAYLAVMRAILPRPETWLMRRPFRVVVNIGHGQNGFLTAALLGGALHAGSKAWLRAC